MFGYNAAPTNAELSIILKLKDQATQGFKKFSQYVQSGSQSLMENMKKHWIAYTAAITASILILKKLWDTTVNFGKDLIGVGSQFEQWQIQMETFTGSTAKAKEKLEELLDFASESPFTPEQIFDATPLLMTLEQAGYKLKEIETIAGNIAIAYGMSFEEAVSNLNKALTGGIEKAKAFGTTVRTQMQLLSGITDLTKVTKTELYEIFQDIFADSSSPLSKGLERFSYTYEGTIKKLESQWLNFKQRIGEKAFETIKMDLMAISKIIEKIQEEGSKYAEVVNDINNALERAVKGFEEFGLTSIIVMGNVIDTWNKLKVGILLTSQTLNEFMLMCARLQSLNPLQKMTEMFSGTDGGLKEALAYYEKNVSLLDKALPEAIKDSSISYTDKARKMVQDIGLLMGEMRDEVAADMKRLEETPMPEPISATERARLEALEKIKDRIHELSTSETEKKLEELEKQMEAYKELGFTEVDLAELRTLEKVEIYKKDTENLEKELEERFKLQNEFNSRMFELTHTEYENSVRLLEAKRKDYMDAGISEERIDELMSLEKQSLLDKEKKKLNDHFDWQKIAADRTYNAISDSFKTFFVDAFDGQLKTAEDYYLAFRSSILNATADLVAQMAAMWVIKSLFPASWLPTSWFHMGGMINKKHLGGAVYAHTGLAVDEVPIIARTGEGVLNKNAMANIGGSVGLNRLNRGGSMGGNNITVQRHYYITAMDAKSFDQYLKEHKDILSETMMESIDEGHKMRLLL